MFGNLGVSKGGDMNSWNKNAHYSGALQLTVVPSSWQWEEMFGFTCREE